MQFLVGGELIWVVAESQGPNAAGAHIEPRTTPMQTHNTDPVLWVLIRLDLDPSLGLGPIVGWY